MNLPPLFECCHLTPHFQLNELERMLPWNIPIFSIIEIKPTENLVNICHFLPNERFFKIMKQLRRVGPSVLKRLCKFDILRLHFMLDSISHIAINANAFKEGMKPLSE